MPLCGLWGKAPRACKPARTKATLRPTANVNGREPRDIDNNVTNVIKQIRVFRHTKLTGKLYLYAIDKLS